MGVDERTKPTRNDKIICIPYSHWLRFRNIGRRDSVELAGRVSFGTLYVLYVDTVNDAFEQPK